MKVWCAACGEELMGSVNRCWKCGKYFPVQPEGGQKPPIRRPPIAVIRPKLVAAPQSEGVNTAEFTATVAQSANTDVTRRGSPFATGTVPRPLQETLALATATRKLGVNAPAAKPEYDLSKGLQGAVLGAIMSAMVAFVVTLIFPYGALLLAMTGLVFAVVGLQSGRRKGATTAVVVCCLAIATSLVASAIDLYQRLGL